MKSSFFLILIFSFFLFLIPLKSVFAENLLIIEVQIAGEKANHDFIKIYNPENSDFDISSFKLRKRASTGGESSIRVFPKGSKILAKHYFLWANSEENFSVSLGANVSSKATLAKNNSLALLNPEGQILDAVSWGESQNPFVEGQSFPENPSPNQKLTRKQRAGLYQDTNNNRQDFYLDPPTEPSLPPKGETKQPEAQAQTEKETQSQIFPSNIFINEIVPSPLGPDEKEEWIEIFNSNNFEADLSGWQISDQVGKTTTYTFSQGTKISSLGFLVLARPESKIVLNNDADGVSLLPPDGKTIETINYVKAPRGQSFARKNSGFFWTSTLTPGKTNIITEPEIETEKEKETEVLGEAVYPSGVFLNEILPSPEGSDETEEWIEIFNSNGFEVDLSFWKIQDTRGRIRTYTFPGGTKISGQGFLVLSRPETKITLNNDGGGLNLINPNGDIVDQISYEKAPQGQSYNKTESGWVWSENLTPEAANITSQVSEEEKEEETKEIPEKGLAAIGQKIPKFPRSFFVLFVALAIAIFSGIIILSLKKKIKPS
jgi:hypothetical protein